jgi:Zn-dependent protease with chaperone function
MKLSPTGLVLRLLIWLYFPFLIVVCLAIAWASWWLARIFVHVFWWPFLVGAVLLGITVVQIVWSLRVLFVRVPYEDKMELRLPRAQLEGLYGLVAAVARKRRLAAPFGIRLAADTVAHVYEDDEGHPILVIGGLAIRSYSQEAIAGIIAHELAHFAAGDTQLSRRAFKWKLLMAVLEQELSTQSASKANPLVWLILLYHLVFRICAAADSRRQELAADRQSVALIGKESAAAALLRLTVTEYLPYLRVSSIAELHVQTQQPISNLFAEQQRRAKTIGESEWENACRRALKRPTGLFDSHPSLKDRLKAMGISSKQAIQLVLDDEGQPAVELFEDWPAIEMQLTEQLVIAYHEMHEAKLDMAQILLGRPLTRR